MLNDIGVQFDPSSKLSAMVTASVFFLAVLVQNDERKLPVRISRPTIEAAVARAKGEETALAVRAEYRG